MCDRRDMKHGIGGAAERHINGQRVQERFLCHDVAGTDIFLQHLHDLHASVLGETEPLGIYRRDRAVALKSHTKRLGDAVHAVRGIHAGTGPAGRADLSLIFRYLFLGELACRIGAYRLKHGREASLPSVDMSGHHRAAADENGRDVDAGSRHQETRNILVAVRNHHQSVELMRDCHALRGIADQITGNQRILHSDVAHGDTITDRNRREHHRHSASLGNAHLHRLSNLVQVHVARNDFVVGADDTD